MVYLGPSRGCETCKRRRKKCDETRPSCFRCLKGNRTCSGYDDSTETSFRRYQTRKPASSSDAHFVSAARKCSLPSRALTPGSSHSYIPHDGKPLEISQELAEGFALRAFFYDYCIDSGNPNISRGFLDNLEKQSRRRGPNSSLSKACKAVACACHGLALRRPWLLDTADRHYQELLGALAKAIENPATADASESKTVAMLLGLYQMIMADEQNPGDHGAHAKGVAAILRIQPSPKDLLLSACNSNLSLLSNKKGSIHGIFTVPDVKASCDDKLDDLLLELHSIRERANSSMKVGELGLLIEECEVLDRRFDTWQNSQSQAFKPTTIGQIKPRKTWDKPPPAFWPGVAHTYFDLYVACVWNTARAARLLLLGILAKLSATDVHAPGHAKYVATSEVLAKDITASVAYHLTESLQQFLHDEEGSAEIDDPGPAVGGLLLMHPLYVASQCSMLSPECRVYMQDCLLWIAKYMGIGQAAVLAKATNIEHQYLENGCILIWSGFLG